MIVDVFANKEVLKITVVNYAKLLIACYLVFYKLPQYIFPQKHIKDSLDRIVFNILYMVISVILILAFLLSLRIFSFFTLILCFILLKAWLIHYFEGRNLFREIKVAYQNLLTKFYDFLDYLEKFIRFGRDYQGFKSLISVQKLYSFNNVRIVVLGLAVIYICYQINIMNFINISYRTSDMPLYSEWIAFLHKNYLYADNLSIGAYFFGPPIIIFFLQLITNIDSTILFSLFPLIFFLFSLICIYYIVFKTSDSHNSAIFAVIIYGVYCLSPLATYILGFVFKTTSPKILNFLGLNIYFDYYNNIPMKNLINYSYIPFIRINSGLPYEMAFTFTPLYIYFFIMSFEKQKNHYLILYLITLILVFTFHGGAAIYLLLASVLILINAVIFGKINFTILKKGILAVFIGTIIGNLWILSVLKYGIPQNFGIAAPMLDTLLKTEYAKAAIIKSGTENIYVLTFYKIQVVIYFLLCLLYPLTLFLKKRRRFVCSSVILFIIAVLIIYLGENLGLPRLVAKSRSAEYLLLGTSIGVGYYFSFFEEIVRLFFREFTNWIMVVIITIFLIVSIFVVPTWNNTSKFYISLNDIQNNEVVLEIYKIKKLRRPYSWTVVGYVQAYSRVLDKGFHINVNNFIKKYNPYSKFLEVPTEYVYIFKENIKSSYKGSGEWYFRWKRDINLQLDTWLQIYSKTHDNIRLFSESPSLSVYEIDNRKYLQYLYEKKLKNNGGH